jgi:hypothetical protein
MSKIFHIRKKQKPSSLYKILLGWQVMPMSSAKNNVIDLAAYRTNKAKRHIIKRTISRTDHDLRKPIQLNPVRPKSKLKLDPSEIELLKLLLCLLILAIYIFSKLP